MLALRDGACARSPLVEALRSRASRGEIVGARQLGRDRIIELELRRRVAAGTSVEHRLILEATEPVASLMLTDASGKIVELARHAAPDRNAYRTLLPGHPYVPPPPFRGASPDDVSELRFEDVGELAGIGRPLARIVQARWGDRDPHVWLAALREAATSDRPLPCWLIGKGYIGRLGVGLPDAVPLGDDALAAAARGVLAPMLERVRQRRLREVGAKIDRALKARARHRDGLLKQMRDHEGADVFRQKGEAILANVASIPRGATEIALTDWEGRSVVVELDPRLSPSKNAERWFKRYRKAKGDPRAIAEALAAVEGAMRELGEQRAFLEAIDDPGAFERAVADIEAWLDPKGKERTRGKGRNAKAKDAPPHLAIEMDGLTILVGLSARGNRYVTFRQARPEDLWLHAHELPGAHAIIRGARDRAELEGPRRDVLERAASLAAWHSKGKGSGHVQVDYTERRHVRPVPGTVALVTYTEPGTLRVVPSAPTEDGRSAR